MTEELLQFIWQFQYFNTGDLKTTAGEALQIIHAGTHNTNQGPDFLNAKIKCSDTVLAGSVEVHINASEWNEHKHSSDPNYNNVILHVVWKEDKELSKNFPVLELCNRVSKSLIDKYDHLRPSKHFIPCSELIGSVNDFTVLSWKERLMAERLQDKANYAYTLLQKNNYHWEEVFWQLLAKNFGGKINGEAFEQIARSLPLSILAKHKNQLHQLEALLLGQAGLLTAAFKEDYPIMLQKEYYFLRKKYALDAVHYPVHFLRMRPANFPTVRLAQLAVLIHQSSHLFSKIKETDSVTVAEKMFNVTANDYWHYHYLPDEPTPFKQKSLGTQMAQNIIINTVLPVLFAYGMYSNTDAYKTKALEWAALLAPEKNAVTRGFEQLNIPNKTAYDSQALLQLKYKYCNEKRCLQCAIGNKILKTT